jgi:hypothetical protein
MCPSLAYPRRGSPQSRMCRPRANPRLPPLGVGQVRAFGGVVSDSESLGSHCGAQKNGDMARIHTGAVLTRPTHPPISPSVTWVSMTHASAFSWHRCCSGIPPCRDCGTGRVTAAHPVAADHRDSAGASGVSTCQRWISSGAPLEPFEGDPCRAWPPRTAGRSGLHRPFPDPVCPSALAPPYWWTRSSFLLFADSPLPTAQAGRTHRPVWPASRSAAGPRDTPWTRSDRRPGGH